MWSHNLFCCRLQPEMINKETKKRKVKRKWTLWRRKLKKTGKINRHLQLLLSLALGKTQQLFHCRLNSSVIQYFQVRKCHCLKQVLKWFTHEYPEDTTNEWCSTVYNLSSGKRGVWKWKNFQHLLKPVKFNFSDFLFLPYFSVYKSALICNWKYVTFCKCSIFYG